MQCFSNITKNTFTVDTTGTPVGSPLPDWCTHLPLGVSVASNSSQLPPFSGELTFYTLHPHFHLPRELKPKAGPAVSRGRTTSSAVHASDRVDQPKVCFTGDHILLFPFLCLVFFTPLKSFPEEH